LRPNAVPSRRPPTRFMSSRLAAGWANAAEMSGAEAELADIIRSAAAWWKLAAERLESGNVDEALAFAKLGRFGTEDAVERIEAHRGEQEASHVA
jgi:hypothetical protein